MAGPCAKTVVTCTLVFPDGRRVVGTNECEYPQIVCPRLPGEDYVKCRSICGQRGHAEEVALEKAGRADGAHAYIEGHTWACQNCQIALFSRGVAALTIGAPPAEGA